MPAAMSGASSRTSPARRSRRAADLVDQLAAEGRGGRELAVAFRLGDVVGGAQRQRAQADLGIPARERRCHEHDEVALFFQQKWKRRDAVDVGHGDVENEDVGIPSLDLLDRFAAAPQRSHDLHVRLGLDPARDHAADDDRVVDHHHTDRLVGESDGGRLCSYGDAHRDTRWPTETRRKLDCRSERFPANWTSRSPQKTRQTQQS
jgi:hypothetical protein